MGIRTQKKRRKQKKTDYKLRMGLLKSQNKRIVVRKTNKYLIVQIVEHEEAKDKVIVGLSSKELLKNGWDKKFLGSLKSIPAAYLTGLLFAKKIKQKMGEENFVLDIGMAIHKKGGRVYALAKGLVDGGLKVKISEEVFPKQERLNGEHLKDEVKTMILNIKEKLK